MGWLGQGVDEGLWGGSSRSYMREEEADCGCGKKEEVDGSCHEVG